MARLFNTNVENNTQNLKNWRNRYEKTEYPEKIVINIFYDLIPLKNLWGRLNPYFGQKLYDDFQNAINKTDEEFRLNQLSLRPNILSMLVAGAKIGNLYSKNYDKLIKEAKLKSNKAIEELEFSYITRVAIKTALLYWFALGIMGFNKEDAYNELFSIQLPPIDFNNFDEVFDLFAQACVTEIAGLQKQDGLHLTSSLYKPLPDYW